MRLSVSISWFTFCCVAAVAMGVAKGGETGPCPQKCLEFLVISCFERQYPMQNTVVSLKSIILAPKNKFWAGYATGCSVQKCQNNVVMTKMF